MNLLNLNYILNYYSYILIREKLNLLYNLTDEVSISDNKSFMILTYQKCPCKKMAKNRYQLNNIPKDMISHVPYISYSQNYFYRCDALIISDMLITRKVPLVQNSFSEKRTLHNYEITGTSHWYIKGAQIRLNFVTDICARSRTLLMCKLIACKPIASRREISLHFSRRRKTDSEEMNSNERVTAILRKLWFLRLLYREVSFI